jgi:hypothetical protein
LRAELSAITIAPFAIEDENGRDGSWYGVELGVFKAAVTLRWWQEAPEGWPGLDAWWRKTVAACEVQLP